MFRPFDRVTELPDRLKRAQHRYSDRISRMCYSESSDKPQPSAFTSGQMRPTELRQLLQLGEQRVQRCTR